MLKLWKKDLLLNMPWPLFVVCLVSLMPVIPNYPYIVCMGYSVLQIYVYLQWVQKNRCMEFSSLLPVRRRDIVVSTMMTPLLLQAIEFAIAAAMCYPSKCINGGNIVGIDANFTLLGMALLCMAVFNLIFFPQYFKTGYKAGVPAVAGLSGFVGTYLLCELPIQLAPVLHTALDGYASAMLWARLTFFAACVILYVLFTFAAGKISVKRFEKVNL